MVIFAAISIYVLWYVGQRRAENRAKAMDPAARRDIGPYRPSAAPEVDLTKNAGKTIDFSSGQPVVKESPSDRAALEQGLREIKEATQNVTFEAQPKKAEPKQP